MERAPVGGRIGVVLARAAAAVTRWSALRALGVLLLVDLALVGALLAGGHFVGPGIYAGSDLPVFEDRARTIVSGGSLYEDTERTTVVPPLVSYFFVVPHLLGGGVVAYGLWFALFSFLGAAVLYLGLRSWSQAAAFGIGLVVVTHPFSVIVAGSMVQDDTIVPLFVAAGLVFLLAQRLRAGAFVTGLGVMVKAWPAVHAPILFFAARSLGARVQVTLVGLGAGLLAVLPFLLASPRGLLPMLRFYALGDAPDAGAFEGLSFWRFLDLAGLGVPQAVNLVLLVSAWGAVWVLTARRRIDPLVAFAAAYGVFFVLYPKMHLGYYILGLVVFAPWMLRSTRRLVALGAMTGAALLAHLFWRERLPVDGFWVVVPIVLAAGILVYWAVMVRTVVRDGPFTAWTPGGAGGTVDEGGTLDAEGGGGRKRSESPGRSGRTARGDRSEGTRHPERAGRAVAADAVARNAWIGAAAGVIFVVGLSLVLVAWSLL